MTTSREDESAESWHEMYSVAVDTAAASLIAFAILTLPKLTGVPPEKRLITVLRIAGIFPHPDPQVAGQYKAEIEVHLIDIGVSDEHLVTPHDRARRAVVEVVEGNGKHRLETPGSYGQAARILQEAYFNLIADIDIRKALSP